MKENVYKIFNDIQTRTHTSENLENLINFFEKKKSLTDFIDAIENIFLIIIKNYEKNNVVLKNIKEFIKSFLEKIVKAKSKDKVESAKTFINHFCKLFTNNVKKTKYKTLCIYFLNIFLIPYSNDFTTFYDLETLEDIKNYIVNILRSKQTVLHSSVLKLLQKHPILQKDDEIWEKLENLLNNSSQGIKKEILKLLSIEDTNILNYLLEMYDDESSEIRHFVYDKLSEMKNFDLIDAKTKVKLFYVGLSDVNSKVAESAKKFLKNYLNSIGIYKSKKNEGVKMEVESEDNNNIKGVPKINKTIKEVAPEDEEDDEEKDDDKYETASVKIVKSSSPLKLNKKKLVDAPSRIFDKLDILTYYNHPKYSSTFQLITDSIIEFTDIETLVEFYRNIIDNMILVSNSQTEMKFLSSEKKKKRNSESSCLSTEGKIEKKALFHDIYFLQNSLNYLANKTDEGFSNLKNTIFEMLPDVKTFAKIMNHFYNKETNILILHQLFLIGLRLNYEDEVGNRDMINFLRIFLSDITLDTKTIEESYFKTLNFDNMNVMFSQPDDAKEDQNQPITEQQIIKTSIENMLLPYTRRIVLSLEDLLEHALKIFLKIHYNQDSQLFNTIMLYVQEIGEPLELDSENPNNLSILKTSQKEIIDKIKEKIGIIAELEEKKRNGDKNRVEIDKKIFNEQNNLTRLDEQLFEITEQEKNILMRQIKLCEFLIKYCKVSAQVFDPMIEKIILPCVQRKEFPDVMRLSYNSMGLLAVNFYNSNYRNFMKLFYDQLEKRNSDEFREIEKISLYIIFDSMLCTNLNEPGIINGSLDDKIDNIIKKFLYHPDTLPRIIAFTGLSKLIIANRITRPEFVISRLLVVLYKSLENNSDRSYEEYNTKIYEIMQNFLYTYCIANKKNIKSIVKAILIIITGKLMGDSLQDYEWSVVQNYKDVKYEFLKQLIALINDFAMGNTLRKNIFKIFKFIYFIFSYTSGEIDEDGLNEETPKNIKIHYKTKDAIKASSGKFLEKTKFDEFLINQIGDENFYIKFFPYLIKLFSAGALKSFSEKHFLPHYNEIQEKNFVYESSNGTMDLGNEEKQIEMRAYVDNKKNKYFKNIEEYFKFIESLKESKPNSIPEENSKVEEEEDANNTFNSKNNFAVEKKKNIVRKTKKIENKNPDIGMIKDEIEEEEKEVEENKTQSNSETRSRSPLKNKGSLANKNNRKIKTPKFKKGEKRKSSVTPKGNMKKNKKK